MGIIKATVQKKRSIDNYAGAWIDENNVPHVAFTGKPDHDVMQMTRNEGVVVEYQNNTYKDIVSLQNNFAEAQAEYGVVSTYIDESKNGLIVKYTDELKLSLIKNIISELNTERVAVAYEYTRESLQNDALQGGDNIYNKATDSNCSIGFRAKKGTTYGYVTAGHCFPVGANTTGGKVVSRVWSPSSNMDAEFINPNVGSLVPNTDRQGSRYQVNDFAVSQGSYVKAASWIANKTGYITSTSASASFKNDGTYTNLFCCSGGSVGGMSGGVNISGPYAIGITKGGGADNRYVVKASKITSSLGLTLY